MFITDSTLCIKLTYIYTVAATCVVRPEHVDV